MALVEVLERVEVLLLPPGLVLLESLDFGLERLSLGNQLFLVLAVALCVLMNVDRCLTDVQLGLMAFVLRVPQQVLVHGDVLLQIIDNLRSIVKLALTATCSLSATMVVLRCSFSTSRSVRPLTRSRSRPA